MNTNKPYKWIVVGAGPGGLAVLGNLLSHLPNDQVLWIDPNFTSGKLKDVPEVPSNTKVSLFLKYFQMTPYLKNVTDDILQNDQDEHHPFRILERMNQDEGCYLGSVVKAVNCVTQAILPNVHHIRATVMDISQIPNEKRWKLTCKKSDGSESILESENVVLSTGSQPFDFDLHKRFSSSDRQIEVIPLEAAFSPTQLSEKISQDDVIAVMGTSHSGILVLRNLCTILPEEFNLKVKQVKSFSKKELLYAEYKDGWIKYDNTGLKLVAARWAKEKYQNEISENLKRIFMWEHNDESTLYRQEFADCTKIIYAVGYKRIPLPSIHLSTDTSDISCQICHNASNGQLMLGNKELSGLYGFGIAFPENYTYPDGNTESLVGMWKFMDYANRVVPKWLLK